MLGDFLILYCIKRVYILCPHHMTSAQLFEG